MAKNWEYKAGELWPRLTTAAKEAKTFHYEDLARHIGTTARNVKYALDPILRFCIHEKLPPLTSLVINKGNDEPGKGFTAGEGRNIGEIHKEVFQHNWDAVGNPFGGFDENDSTETLARALLHRPDLDGSGEIYAKVKVRGTAQAIFRKALLKAYGSKCSMCGLSFEEALEAAHIIPWSEASDAEKISPLNGILLCSNHHKLFDAGLIEISEDFAVRYVEKSYSGSPGYSEADEAATIKVDGRHLRLPKEEKLRPLPELIHRRQKA